MLTPRPARVPVAACAALTVVLGACTDAVLTPPTAPAIRAVSASPADSGLAAAPASTPVNIAGTWTWQQTTMFEALPFTAKEILGIEPEGPVTRVTCESGGTMFLTQSGASFSGSATQASTCRTQGGVVFNPVPVPFPPAPPVENGTIQGHNFRFDFSGCPQTGAIRVANAYAVELRGTGDCSLPREWVASYKDVRFVARR